MCKIADNDEMGIDDGLLKAILDQIEKEESGEHLNDEEKIALIDRCCDVLHDFTEGATVTTVLNAPFKSMGYISLVGKDIEFLSSEAMRVVSLAASNLNIYPKVDGSVRIDFTFHGVAKRKDD